MTRNYHRLWQRPHRPHRDSPYPDVPDIPDVPDVPEEHVHLYTFQSDFYPEEFEDFDHPYYPETPDQNETPSNPMFDHGVTSEYESWDEYDHQYRVTSADVDGPYDERELSAEESEPEPSDLNDSFDHGNNHDLDPREPYYANSENSDHFDHREPPNYDYYDHSDGNYEPNYDYYEENFDRQPRQRDYDYDDYECYPDDPEDLDHQLQRLEIGDERPEHDAFGTCNTPNGSPPNQDSHFAYKDVFWHEQAGQHFHIECSICVDYMLQWDFSVPPLGYDFKKDGNHH